MRSFVKYFFMAYALFFIFSFQNYAKDKRYKVSLDNNNFYLTSPFGQRVYIGDLGLSKMRSYRFEIPIEDLKPTNPNNSSPSGYGQSAAGQDLSQLSDGKAQAKLIDSEEELILEANRSYNEGKFNRAVELIDEALKRNSKNIRAWIMKGSLMHLKGHSDLAKIYWKKAAKLDPNNPNIKKLIGE